MVWFKVDDKLHSNTKIRKVLADEPAALALWTVAGSWSSDELTDGFIPDSQLPWLFPADAEQLAQRLVNARLWRRVRGGYQFHEWEKDGDGTKRNPSKKEVEEDRRKKAEAGRKGGFISGRSRSKKQAPASANAAAPADEFLQPPTRPDPLPSKEGGSGDVAPRFAQGAPRRSPEDPPPAMRVPQEPIDLAEVRAKIQAARRKVHAKDRRPAVVNGEPHDPLAALDAALAEQARAHQPEGDQA